MRRRAFLGQAAGVAAAGETHAYAQQPMPAPPPADQHWWRASPVSVADWPLLLGPERQLFIDDHVIAEKVGIEKQFHQPIKHPAYVLSPERPWEGTACLAHGSIVEERSGRLRMYYIGSAWHVPFERASENPHNNVCVAYSNDGVNWEKPGLGMYPYFGLTGTNLVLPVDPKTRTYEQFSVIHRPDDPEKSKRWRMGCFLPGRGLFLDDPKDSSRLRIGKGPYEESCYYAFFSEDGLKWRMRAEPVFTNGWTLDQPKWPMDGVAENSSIMFDAVRQKYVAFIRIWDVRPGRGRLLRARGITESSDFLHWTTPRVLFLPLEDDEPGLQFYSSTGFNYESMYLGLLRCYRAGTGTRGLSAALHRQRCGGLV